MTTDASLWMLVPAAVFAAVLLANFYFNRSCRNCDHSFENHFFAGCEAPARRLASDTKTEILRNKTTDVSGRSLPDAPAAVDVFYLGECDCNKFRWP